MNPEIKAKWLEALRSARYEQGTIHLRSKDNKFCCLGVLSDLLHPDEWEERLGTAYMADGMVCTLGSNTRQEVGFDPAANTCTELAEMNDGGKSFAEIADYIEANL